MLCHYITVLPASLSAACSISGQPGQKIVEVFYVSAEKKCQFTLGSRKSLCQPQCAEHLQNN